MNVHGFDDVLQVVPTAELARAEGDDDVGAAVAAGPADHLPPGGQGCIEGLNIATRCKFKVEAGLSFTSLILLRWRII